MISTTLVKCQLPQRPLSSASVASSSSPSPRSRHRPRLPRSRESFEAMVQKFATAAGLQNQPVESGQQSSSDGVEMHSMPQALESTTGNILVGQYPGSSSTLAPVNRPTSSQALHLASEIDKLSDNAGIALSQQTALESRSTPPHHIRLQQQPRPEAAEDDDDDEIDARFETSSTTSGRILRLRSRTNVEPEEAESEEDSDSDAYAERRRFAQQRIASTSSYSAAADSSLRTSQRPIINVQRLSASLADISGAASTVGNFSGSNLPPTGDYRSCSFSPGSTSGSRMPSLYSETVDDMSTEAASATKSAGNRYLASTESSSASNQRSRQLKPTAPTQLTDDQLSETVISN